jgi:anti-sigma factor RsiW
VNDCVNAEVRDALPGLLHGRLSDVDTATMMAHVESCADCRAELALLREVRAAAPIAPPVDAARIAAAIQPYSGTLGLEAPSAPKSVFGRVGGWRLATAVVLVAAGAWTVSDSARESLVGRDQRVAQVAPAAGPALATSVASLSLVSGVQDLSDAQLVQLLADLDGMETIPSEEPDPLALPLDDTGEQD